MFYLSQSEFRFQIIMAASNFGIGKTISFAENIASLPKLLEWMIVNYLPQSFWL
jgi:hypothetical protein